MRIVQLAANAFGYNVCERLVQDDRSPVGIFTSPEQFEISYSESEVKNVLYRDMKDFEDRGIPVVEVSEQFDSTENYQRLKKWNPDLLLVTGWYYLVPEPFRDLATYGAVGVHHSLLPKYRGGAPLVWALINGEDRTGTSLFFLEEGVDTGDILAQREFEITRDDDIGDVYERANELAFEMIDKELEKFESDSIVATPQDESKATEYPQRSPEDGEINWNWPAQKIYDFVRAQTKPYPGAFTSVEGQTITIWKAEVLDRKFDKPPGTPIESENLVFVCGDGMGLRVLNFEQRDR